MASELIADPIKQEPEVEVDFEEIVANGSDNELECASSSSTDHSFIQSQRFGKSTPTTTKRSECSTIETDSHAVFEARRKRIAASGNAKINELMQAKRTRDTLSDPESQQQFVTSSAARRSNAKQSSSFKVVQKLLENNKRTLAVVPSGWHSRLPNGKGILMWPTGLPNIGKLQRNSQSTPGTISDGWQMFECCLRRYGIASFESAVSQMREIAKADGTKTDSECVRPTKIHYKTRTQESPVVDETKTQGKPVDAAPPQPPSHTPITQSQCANSENILFMLKAAQQVAATACCSNGGSSKHIEEGMNKILGYLARLENKIDNIEHKLNVISTKVDEDPVDELDSGINETFKMISFPDELTSFEEQLASDKEFRTKNFKLIKHAIGHLHHLKGHDLAYRIVDLMFDRKLFTHYTWTGMSKSGQKQPFNVHTNTHTFFKRLVHIHDKSYTDCEVKVFFQSKNLQHSDRRSVKPILRISSTKHRSGNQQLKTRKNKHYNFMPFADPASQSRFSELIDDTMDLDELSSAAAENRGQNSASNGNSVDPGSPVASNSDVEEDYDSDDQLLFQIMEM